MPSGRRGAASLLTSKGTNLVAEDTNAVADIFVHVR